MSTAPAIGRILIAMDASRKSLDVLEVAVALAAHRQIELATLFIEDVNLINLAGLPFAREIDLLSTVERRLDDLQMARTLRTQARQISRMLDRLAAQLKVSYSFTVVRGSYMSEVLSASENTDILFLSRSVGRLQARTAGKESGAAPSMTSFPHTRNALYVVYDGSPDSDRALALANDLALTVNRELVVLLCGTTPEDSERLRQQVIPGIESGVPVQYVVIATLDDPALDRAIRRRDCSMLILPRNTMDRADLLAGALLDQSDCPVVLV